VNATQTVFGEGPASAEVMLVGEQPGDLEDRAGHPFVGPAGKLLDKALLQAGIDRTRVYVTNSVKHFKFVPIEGERQALLGKQFRVTEARGKPMPSELAEAVVATVHPSAVLRAPTTLGSRPGASSSPISKLWPGT
jgi:DNA polymerase